MFLRTATSTLAVLALTVPAFGDVSPAEVWQGWVEYYQANGYNVTEGAREQAGDTLTLRDVAFTYASPEAGVDLRAVAAEITLLATGDGRVRTRLSDTIPLTMQFAAPDDAEGEDATLIGVVNLRDGEILSSGSPDDMTHETRMAEVAVVLQTVQTGDTTREIPVSLRIANLTSRQSVTRSDMLRFGVEMSADQLNLDADLANLPDFDSEEDGSGDTGPATFTLTGTVSDLRGASTGVVPLDAATGSDMAAALRAGFDISGNLAAGGGRFEVAADGTDADGQPKNLSGHYALTGPDLAFALGPDGMKYQGALDAVEGAFSFSDIPVPISYSVAETTFDVQMPVLKSDEPAPFKLAYSIGGLTLADGIWDMFDPQKVMPRDPASLDIDITGMLRLAMDLFDPALAQAAEAAGADTAGNAAVHEAAPVPFEPTEISLNKIALSAVGASFDSSGELRVPEGGDKTQPVGTLNARLEGVNALIDRLVQLGVVGSEEVAGYRMMLAMFARPAPEGGDALVSEFEFREGGEIFANGQQVK